MFTPAWVFVVNEVSLQSSSQHRDREGYRGGAEGRERKRKETDASSFFVLDLGPVDCSTRPQSFEWSRLVQGKVWEEAA